MTPGKDRTRNTPKRTPALSHRLTGPAKCGPFVYPRPIDTSPGLLCNLGMQVKPWIKGAQSNGWRVARVSGLTIELRCSKHGCPGHMTVSIENPGPVPEPCEAPHVKGYSAKTFAQYQALVEEFRRKRRSLGLDQIDVNDAVGLADGHISKLESFAKIASPPTLQLWAQTIGLYLTTTPAPLPAATIKAIDERARRPYNPNQARWKHKQEPEQ